VEIYPSLISSNLLNLQSTINQLDSYCDGYHLDIMDDHFVPNLTWGPAFINAISESTHLPLQVHLMVDNPAAWIDRLKLCVNDCFVFHGEAVEYGDALLLINRVKSKKVKVGVALNPETPIRAIEYLLPQLDHVLVMAVEPGFSGQKFIPSILNKVNELAHIRSAQCLPFKIGVDGGVTYDNIALLAQHHVDLVCVASAIFFKPNPLEALQYLYKQF
jgi:ribulose-phosphate 3-epimerase